MKKIYSLLLILVLPLLSACEGYLDKPDSDDVTVDKAFETVKPCLLYTSPSPRDS